MYQLTDTDTDTTQTSIISMMNLLDRKWSIGVGSDGGTLAGDVLELLIWLRDTSDARQAEGLPSRSLDRDEERLLKKALAAGIIEEIPNGDFPGATIYRATTGRD